MDFPFGPFWLASAAENTFSVYHICWTVEPDFPQYDLHSCSAKDTWTETGSSDPLRAHNLSRTRSVSVRVTSPGSRSSLFFGGGWPFFLPALERSRDSRRSFSQSNVANCGCILRLGNCRSVRPSRNGQSVC